MLVRRCRPGTSVRRHRTPEMGQWFRRSWALVAGNREFQGHRRCCGSRLGVAEPLRGQSWESFAKVDQPDYAIRLADEASPMKFPDNSLYEEKRRAGHAGPQSFVLRVDAMLAPTTVTEIRRLLNEGRLSQRNIARTLGISRGIVHAIASGKRRDRVSLAQTVEESVVPSGLPKRCPTCGGMVHMPCLLCRVRRIREQQVFSRNSGR
jgi:DNA-binding XRE family transcriptional regulator